MLRGNPSARSWPVNEAIARALLVAGMLVAGGLALTACSNDDTGSTADVRAEEEATARSTSARGGSTATPTALPHTTPGSSPSPGAASPGAASPGASPPASRTATPAAAEATGTPTVVVEQRPQPAPGAQVQVVALHLASAGIDADWPLESGDTVFIGGVEYFADPSAPANIMWYPRFSRTGHPAGNTMMAAHVNYVGFGNGPFAYLLDAQPDDALYLTLDDGTEIAYAVKSVMLYTLAEIDMNAIVYPDLDVHTERVTLMSCGGTFIPAASGYGGEYDSRVVLVAERYVP